MPTATTVVGLKEKNYLFFVALRYCLLFNLFDAGVILVQVYNMLNFICVIYMHVEEIVSGLMPLLVNNVYIMAVK